MADDRTAAQAGQGQNPYAQQPQQQAQPPIPPVQVQPAPAARPGQVAGRYRPCPKCGSPDVKKVGFTWWGGALGPSLFCHCKCQQCKTTFNGKTGRSNNTAIAIYMIVALVLAVVIFVLIAVAES